MVNRSFLRTFFICVYLCSSVANSVFLPNPTVPSVAGGISMGRFRDLVRGTSLLASISISMPGDLPAKLRRPSPPATGRAQGRELFGREWVPGDPRSHGGDGLGPLYNETALIIEITVGACRVPRPTRCPGPSLRGRVRPGLRTGPGNHPGETAVNNSPAGCITWRLCATARPALRVSRDTSRRRSTRSRKSAQPIRPPRHWLVPLPRSRRG